MARGDVSEMDSLMIIIFREIVPSRQVYTQKKLADSRQTLGITLQNYLQVTFVDPRLC